jgi:hypothetical protein
MSGAGWHGRLRVVLSQLEQVVPGCCGTEGEHRADFAFVMDKSYPICKPIKKCIIDPLGSSVLRWTVWWP